MEFTKDKIEEGYAKLMLEIKTVREKVNVQPLKKDQATFTFDFDSMKIEIKWFLLTLWYSNFHKKNIEFIILNAT